MQDNKIKQQNLELLHWVRQNYRNEPFDNLWIKLVQRRDDLNTENFEITDERLIELFENRDK